LAPFNGPRRILIDNDKNDIMSNCAALFRWLEVAGKRRHFGSRRLRQQICRWRRYCT